MAQVPIPYAEPYYGGFFTPYGTQTLLGSHMVGMTAARVPLPLDLADDGPIYVNAKQYRGILRRRQSRAKLEAQRKLVKSRKPYLHESRHVHALNRVRGSGGRFLSTKKHRELGPASPATKLSLSDAKNTLQLGSCHLGSSDLSGTSITTSSGTDLSSASNKTCNDATNFPSNDAGFRQPDSRSSGLTTHISGGMQSSGSLACSRTQHCASTVR